jgi:hypothetical protein
MIPTGQTCSIGRIVVRTMKELHMTNEQGNPLEEGSSPKRPLSPNEKARIRARSGLAIETIVKCWNGTGRVQEASRLRFDRALVEEGITA